MAKELTVAANIERVPNNYKIEIRHPQTKVLYTGWAETRYQAEMVARRMMAELGLTEFEIAYRSWSATEKHLPAK